MHTVQSSMTGFSEAIPSSQSSSLALHFQQALNLPPSLLLQLNKALQSNRSLAVFYVLLFCRVLSEHDHQQNNESMGRSSVDLDLANLHLPSSFKVFRQLQEACLQAQFNRSFSYACEYVCFYHTKAFLWVFSFCVRRIPLILIIK